LIATANPRRPSSIAIARPIPRDAPVYQRDHGTTSTRIAAARPGAAVDTAIALVAVVGVARASGTHGPPAARTRPAIGGSTPRRSASASAIARLRCRTRSS